MNRYQEKHNPQTTSAVTRGHNTPTGECRMICVGMRVWAVGGRPHPTSSTAFPPEGRRNLCAGYWNTARLNVIFAAAPATAADKEKIWARH